MQKKFIRGFPHFTEQDLTSFKSGPENVTKTSWVY